MTDWKCDDDVLEGELEAVQQKMEQRRFDLELKHISEADLPQVGRLDERDWK